MMAFLASVDPEDNFSRRRKWMWMSFRLPGLFSSFFFFLHTPVFGHRTQPFLWSRDIFTCSFRMQFSPKVLRTRNTDVKAEEE